MKLCSGRVDRSRARIEIERGVSVHGHHVVLGLRLRALVGAVRVELLKPEQLPLVERGEILALRSAQVAAGSLDPKHFDVFAR